VTSADGGPSTADIAPVASSHESHKRTGLAGNVASLAASQLVTWLLTLAWTLVVPRVIGPDGMGVLVTATSSNAILGVILGLPTKDFLTREIVAHPDDAPTLLGSAFVFRICCLPVFVVSVGLYVHFANLGHTGVVVMYLVTGSTICMLLTDPALAAFQAVERMEYLALSDVSNKSIQTLGGILLVLLGSGVVGLSVLAFAGGVISLALALIWLRPLVVVDLRQDVRGVWSVARASAPYWTFGVFFMVYLWIDAVMLGLLAPAKVVGEYGVATRLFTTLMVVPVVISTAYLPRLVSAFGESAGRLLAVARAPAELIVILSLPICVGLALSAAIVIPLLYGSAYGQAAPVLAILALCLPPMYLNIFLNQILVAAGRPLVWACLMGGATVFNPVANLVLVRVSQARWQNGALGAAASLLLTELLIVSVGIAIVGRRVFSRHSAWRMGRALVAAVAMAVTMRALSGVGLVPMASSGLAVFLVGALVLRVVSPEERQLVGSAAGRLLRSRRRGR
jgi:lipopolysaccharide exporter